MKHNFPDYFLIKEVLIIKNIKILITCKSIFHYSTSDASTINIDGEKTNVTETEDYKLTGRLSGKFGQSIRSSSDATSTINPKNYGHRVSVAKTMQSGLRQKQINF